MYKIWTNYLNLVGEFRASSLRLRLSGEWWVVHLSTRELKISWNYFLYRCPPQGRRMRKLMRIGKLWLSGKHLIIMFACTMVESPWIPCTRSLWYQQGSCRRTWSPRRLQGSTPKRSKCLQSLVLVLFSTSALTVIFSPFLRATAYWGTKFLKPSMIFADLDSWGVFKCWGVCMNYQQDFKNVAILLGVTW